MPYKLRILPLFEKERNIPEMKIELKVNHINYGDLAAWCLPMLSDKLAKEDGAIPGLLSRLAAMSPGMARGMLNALPEEKKNELAVYLLNRNRDQILAGITRYLQKQGVDVEFGDLSVEG